MSLESRTAAAAASKSGTSSASGLMARLLEDATALVRNEIALAKAELMQAGDAFKASLAAVAMGSMIVAAGALTLIAAVVLGLATVLAPWLAALLVGMALTAIGIVLLTTARKKLSPRALTLDRTRDSLQKDAAIAARRT